MSARSKFFLILLYHFLLIVLQVKEIMQLVYEGEKMVPYDGDRVEEAEGGKDGDVGEDGRRRRWMTRGRKTRRRRMGDVNGDG